MADEQKSLWRVAGETLPLVSLAGVTLALSYAVGFFTPFGMEWLNFLTIADVLGGIWFMVPTTLGGLVLGFLFHVTGRPRPAGASDQPTPINVVAFIKNLIIGLTAVIGFSVLMIVRAHYPEDFKLIATVTMLHGAGVFFLPELYLRHARARSIMILCFTYGAITIVLGFGMMFGELKKQEHPSTYVALTNGRSLCRTLIGQFGGGLLVYNPETRTPTFILRDQVAAVAKIKGCGST